MFAAGMSGSQQGETSQRRSKRLEEKRGGVIIQVLPRFRLNEERRTASQTEGDVIVLSLEEPSPIRESPREETESIFSEEREEVDTETEDPPIPMALSTRLKYSSFRGDGNQDADDWFCEFESIAMANQENPPSKRRIFQGLLKGEALKWYQDVPEETRADWTDFTALFLKTFREAGGETIKINIIYSGGPISMLEVTALRIWTLEVANASGRAEREAHVIGDIGGLSLSPNMAVIAFVHAFHGFGFCMRGRDTNSYYHQSKGGGNSPLEFARCYILAF